MIVQACVLSKSYMGDYNYTPCEGRERVVVPQARVFKRMRLSQETMRLNRTMPTRVNRAYGESPP